MKKYSTVKLLVLIAAVLTIASCKKEAGTPEIYFSTTSATTTRGGEPVVVNIELSETNDENVVELFVESIGDDPFTLGSINETYVQDDSSKCEAVIGSGAFIEDQGHIKLGRGTKSVSITFYPLYDHFPHASANFKIKMTSAVNANIRQGSSEFALSIADADIVKTFNSTLNYLGLEGGALDTIFESGIFDLESFEHTTNGNGTFTFKLTYAKSSGNSALQKMTVTYAAFPSIQKGVNNITCASSPLSVAFEPNDLEVTGASCAEFENALTSINGVENGSVYGNYYTLNGTIAIKDSLNFQLSGNISSSFLLNQ